MRYRRRAVVLVIIGLACVAFSIGNFVAIIYVWNFFGASPNVLVAKRSLIAVIYMNCVSIVLGTIGGYLIGRYLREKEMYEQNRTG